MTRRAVWLTAGAALAAIGAWQALAQGENASETASSAAPAPAVAPAPAPPPPPPPLSGRVTPMAERVATLGILNKRNGLHRTLDLKPGQAVRIGDLIVRLKACETTAPWEPEHHTGAFVQVIVQGSDEKWRKHFSGWLFKESPSLNVVEHPIYDVWTRDCAMKHPETGPDTLVVRGGDGAAPAARRSNAPKSPADAAPSAEASAAESNTI